MDSGVYLFSLEIVRHTMNNYSRCGFLFYRGITPYKMGISAKRPTKTNHNTQLCARSNMPKKPKYPCAAPYASRHLVLCRRTADFSWGPRRSSTSLCDPTYRPGCTLSQDHARSDTFDKASVWPETFRPTPTRFVIRTIRSSVGC